jgi:hypothetical protein
VASLRSTRLYSWGEKRPWYPWDNRFGGYRRRSGRYGKYRSPSFCLKTKPDPCITGYDEKKTAFKSLDRATQYNRTAAFSLLLLTISRCRSLVQGVSVNCVVCSNLASTSSGLSSVSKRYVLADFLSRSDPADLTFLICSWMPVVLWTVFPENLRPNFYLNHISHTIRTEKHVAEQRIEPHWYTQQ